MRGDEIGGDERMSREVRIGKVQENRRGNAREEPSVSVLVSGAAINVRPLVFGIEAWIKSVGTRPRCLS